MTDFDCPFSITSGTKEILGDVDGSIDPITGKISLLGMYIEGIGGLVKPLRDWFFLHFEDEITQAIHEYLESFEEVEDEDTE